MQDFAKQYNISSPFLMDSNGKVGRLYQLPGTPVTYFIDPQGVVQSFQPGFINVAWIESNLKKSS